MIETFFSKGTPQIVAAGVLVVLVMYFGPIVFGQHWYYDGYDAGVVVGGFFSYVLFCKDSGAIGISSSDN